VCFLYCAAVVILCNDEGKEGCADKPKTPPLVNFYVFRAI